VLFRSPRAAAAKAKEKAEQVDPVQQAAQRAALLAAIRKYSK
jgi:hypothetical protein